MTKRTFIAIDIYPGKKLLQAAKLIHDHFLSENIRWVRLDTVHITLAFLGDTEPDRVLLVKGLLNERLAGFGPVEIEVSGTGFFGRRNDPKVLWFGVSINDALTGLHKIVNGITEEAGLVSDSRPFRPHITIGRIRKFSGSCCYESLPEDVRKGILMKTSISEVIFYESILRQDGPVYMPIDIIKLSG
jgi:2'-5' RNA ligase